VGAGVALNRAEEVRLNSSLAPSHDASGSHVGSDKPHHCWLAMPSFWRVRSVVASLQPLLRLRMLRLPRQPSHFLLCDTPCLRWSFIVRRSPRRARILSSVRELVPAIPATP